MEFIVEKIGMSRTVDTPSEAVTLLKIVDAKVCEVKDNGKAIVAFVSGKKHNRAIEGQQKKYGISKEYNSFMTLLIGDGAEAGDLDVAPLGEANIVKTSLKTKGRGFQGGMKRHGFGGGPASHGHRFGRRIGSIGMCEWPGRVQPGQKMPGQYGNVNVTTKNRVISFDAQNMILVLKGSIPGHNGARGKVRIVK